MKERPILFSTPMVQAIQSGVKTQMRRTRGLELLNEKPAFWDGGYNVFSCPYGAVGDRLWIRETWDYAPEFYATNDGGSGHFIYRADGHQPSGYSDGWKPSIHMPRRASRITLEITNINVERLQDISEEDAKAEGVEPTVFDEFDIAEIKFEDPECEESKILDILGPGQIPAKANFMMLWDKINGKKHPWASNPWVWAIGFKKL